MLPLGVQESVEFRFGVWGTIMTLGALGGLLLSVTVIVSVASSPLGSVTVASHEISSFLDAMLASNVMEAVVPNIVPLVVFSHS
jgi:hypothetical protein